MAGTAIQTTQPTPDAEALVQIEADAASAGKSFKKAFERRATPDGSQRMRRAVQVAFLLLNVWLGAQFYLFVRQFETAGSAIHVARLAGVEGWLPIAALMNLKSFVLSGKVPHLHPAGMFLLMAFLGMSILFRKSFCGWLCPVGTVSEYLWKQGRSIFRRNFALPKWADIPLRSLKYVLLGLFAWVVVTMPLEGIYAFLESPYGLIADVKMLDFFRHMTVITTVVLAVLALLSVFVRNFWCRYLCPYGALMGLGALLSPLRIRRDAALCIDCAKCAKACPSQIPVDRKASIASAECLGCLECLNVCPAEGALAMKAPGGRSVPAWAIAAGVLLVFAGFVGAAKLTGHWDSNLPNEVYQRLIPQARWLSHP